MLFELKRIASKKNIIAFILFTLFSFYFVYSGVSGYQDFKKEKENFIQYEKLKVKQYGNYEQYGSYGFRLLFQPSPLNIFFNSSTLKTTETNIDTKEIIKINRSGKGKSIFQSIGYFKGFSDFILLFGSLLMLYLGLTTFKSIKDIQFYKDTGYVIKIIIYRLLHLNLFFFILCVSVFLLAIIRGINFSDSDIEKYFLYILYTLIFQSIFYISGVLISLFTIKNKKLTLKLAFLFWGVFIILIPEISNKYIAIKSKKIESIEKVNIEKLKTVMDFERKSMELYLEKIKKDSNVDKLKLKREIMSSFMNGSYNINEEIENELFNEVREMISFHEKLSLISPTNYYSLLAGEGYYSHIQFLDYIIEMRHNFMKFYIKKRQFSKKSEIEPFIKNSENIFKAQSHLPPTFWTATGINLIFILILFFISRRLIKRHLADNEKMSYDGPFEFHRVKVGDICYVYCGDEQQRDKLFRSLRGDETIFIDQISPEDFDSNIKLKDFFYLAQKIEETDMERAQVYLEKMGIDAETLNKRIEEVPFETFKKFYCAVKFANLQKYLMISDYARESSKDFNHKFRTLLSYINKIEGKTIVYLSKEMFDILSVHLKYREICENSVYQIFRIDEITAIAL